MKKNSTRIENEITIVKEEMAEIKEMLKEMAKAAAASKDV